MILFWRKDSSAHTLTVNMCGLLWPSVILKKKVWMSTVHSCVLFFLSFQWQSWKMFSCEWPWGIKLQHFVYSCHKKNPTTTKMQPQQDPSINVLQCMRSMLKHNSRGLDFSFLYVRITVDWRPGQPEDLSLKPALYLEARALLHIVAGGLMCITAVFGWNISK